MNPLISVIIPYYKASSTIERCLSSVLLQKEVDVETLIVVDEKDSEGVLFLKGQFNDSIKIIEGGSGVSANRNIGIDKSSGEYLFFLDADDYLANANALSNLVDILKESDADIAIGGNAEDPHKNHNDNKGYELYRGEEALKEHLKDRPFTYCCWNALFKRQCLNSIRFNEELLVGEDALFMFEVFCQKPTVCVANNLLTYIHTITTDSLSTSWKKEKSDSQFKSLEIREKAIEKEYPHLHDAFLGLKAHALQNYLVNLAKGKDEESKKRYKETKKEYLKLRSHWFSQKELVSPMDKRFDVLIRMNLLKIFIRVKG